MLRKVCLVAVFTCYAASSFSQSAEPFWRVLADETDVSMPAYNGERSPFPYVEPPKVEIVEVFKEPEIIYDPSLIEREARNKKAAEILAEIRDILLSETAFNPDLSNVVVSGVIKGERGNSALIDNQWVGSGEELKVPVQAVDRLVGLVGYLRSLSPDLSESVQQKIDIKLAEIGRFKLRLDRIEERSVVFKDNNNKTYVILFEHMS
ncbi:MAG: hypothetical protein VX730_04465 [Pseudomonadota bacterium]|nr:hypothetical protein [Pseudomonadota bacterium]